MTLFLVKNFSVDKLLLLANISFPVMIIKKEFCIIECFNKILRKLSHCEFASC